MKISLRTRLVVASLLAVTATAVACIFVQWRTLRRQGIDLTRDSMRAVILGAENIRNSISDMRETGVFPPMKPLPPGVAYHETADYKTVPVVAAWRAIREVADKESYSFRISAHSPRNKKNSPEQSEIPILDSFERDGAKEYFAVDSSRGEIVYARPIRLSRDCLACHGEPSTSPTGNGRDMLGLPMEGWKEGQVHGAFVLRASLDRLNPVIFAGFRETLLWLFPVCMIVGGLFAWTVGKIVRSVASVAHRLGEASTAVLGAATQVARTSDLLAHNASTQAASLEETSAAGHEIRTMAQNNSERLGQASELVASSAGQISAGMQRLNEMLGAMHDINESGSRISGIIRTIEEIAFQTNVLSLNAAVEAARAGEAGAGFAIVADEVRELAHRSAEASRDTERLIQDSLAKTAHGEEVSRKLAEIFAAISASSKATEQLVDAATLGSREQSLGVDQVASSLSQLEQVTLSNVAGADENSQSAAALRSHAGTMQNLIAELEGVVAGKVT